MDIIRPLGGGAELVRFRDGKGVGVLDLSKADHPSLRMVAAIMDPGQTQPLGETGFLGVDEPYNYVRATPRDDQVVDISTPSDPVLLITVSRSSTKLPTATWELRFCSAAMALLWFGASA